MEERHAAAAGHGEQHPPAGTGRKPGAADFDVIAALAGMLVFLMIVGGAALWMHGWQRAAAMGVWSPAPFLAWEARVRMPAEAAGLMESAGRKEHFGLNEHVGLSKPQGFPEPAATEPDTRLNPEVSLAPAVWTLADQASRVIRSINLVPREAGMRRAQMAIVIDDWGYPWTAANEFLSLNEPITVAVLPFLPRSEDQARRAAAAGHEVILHLPMEPMNPDVDMGRGGISTDMDRREISAAVYKAVQAVPGVVGVNNHMGSKATTDPRVMEQVLRSVAELDLFFLDSLTTPHSVVASVAQRMAVPHAVNTLFLDNQPTQDWVRRRLEEAKQIALTRGQVIVIGHVRAATYQAIIEMIPVMQAAGIQLVPVSHLLYHPVAPPRAPVFP